MTISKTTDPLALIEYIKSKLPGNTHPVPIAISMEPNAGQEEWIVFVEGEAPGKRRVDVFTTAPDLLTALRTAALRTARESSW